MRARLGGCTFSADTYHQSSAPPLGNLLLLLPDEYLNKGFRGQCRAQVVLAAVQSPLLEDTKHASVLVPRLCSCILMAPPHCRHVSLYQAWI